MAPLVNASQVDQVQEQAGTNGSVLAGNARSHFTEADLAGEKRPGASKAREAVAPLPGGAQGQIVYSNNPAQFGGTSHPQLIKQGYPDTRRTDFSSILQTGPRQEITGPQGRE
ncbi:hypothetical protein F5883DRAFT_653118 [Diaporthe sp. PMI_573]|nr:hypothetical protein F5883DRAFT_653118 [Diaporthaceae sp. PMI_573]